MTVSGLGLFLPDEAATLNLGASLAEVVGPGIIRLQGELGAGKTCFVQGLALGLGVEETVPVISPTFCIHARYAGRRELNHIDAYRLAGAPDHDRLGFEELFADAGITAVEWPSLLDPELRPADSIEITFILAGETRRTLAITVADSDRVLLDGLAATRGIAQA